jgi:glycosyltransferase involved in cell wall biosynthesis
MESEKIQCSIPILTLNSGKTLRKCLESVVDFSDVYIFDGNSTDDTLEIAKEFNIPVYKQCETEEKNIRIKNFTEARIKTEKAAKHDWIFVLDSDEYISPELRENIRKILSSSPEVTTMYSALLKLVMDNRIIEYTFNNAPYTPRLYNTKSGVGWKSAKAVHEKLFVPNGVKVVNLPYALYAHSEALYSQAIKKDDYYLSLVRKRMLSKRRYEKPTIVLIRAIMRNFLRAFNILYKSIKVYARHGFKESLPVAHVWRFMRYHFIISSYRLKELLAWK